MGPEDSHPGTGQREVRSASCTEVMGGVWLMTMALLGADDKQEGPGSGPREVSKLWSQSMTIRSQSKATHTGKPPRVILLPKRAFLAGFDDWRRGRH